MPHLAGLRGCPGALVSDTGRVVAGEPYGEWPERVALRPDADRVVLDDGREMVVEQLAEGFLLRAPQTSARAAPRSALSLRFTGEGGPSAVLDGRSIPLTLRPAELLTALALHPDGLTAEQLALLLYGDEGNPTTVRGEVLRLRSLIGADVLRTRPYRLAATVDTDFQALARAIRDGRPADALRACAGALLPRSDAPAIRELRDELEVGLRGVVLESDDPDLLAEFAAHPLGREDLEVHDRLLDLLPASDPRRGTLAARRARLVAEG